MSQMLLLLWLLMLEALKSQEFPHPPQVGLAPRTIKGRSYGMLGENKSFALLKFCI